LASSDRSAVYCRLINPDIYQQYMFTILLARFSPFIVWLKQAAHVVIELCELLGQLKLIRAYRMTEMRAQYAALEYENEYDMYLQSL
jgi:hypothetical protein